MTSSEMAGIGLSVAIPASVIADTPHPREKTSKLGLIARACAVFGVNEIILYADDNRRDQREELSFCEQILSFIETPQYLRKRIFRISPTLRYAGILPPLQTPHHTVPNSLRESKIGDLRDGVVIGRQGGDLIVEVGLERALRCRGEYSTGTRLTLRLTGVGENLTGEKIDRSKISIYWGYQVRRSKFKLGTLLENEKFELRIGTSRYGTKLVDAWSEISRSLKNVGSVLLAFGSPRWGLREILAQEAKDAERVFDFFVNTVPDQNVSTVRTEEAILISLATFNVMRAYG